MPDRAGVAAGGGVKACGSGHRAALQAGGRGAKWQANFTDAVQILGYLFLGATTKLPDCFDAADADADDNGRVSITDAIRELNYLFLGGAALESPGSDV